MATATRYIKDNTARGVLLAALLLIWNINYHSDSHFSLCLFRLLFDTHCYGCGTLRGISALLHFDGYSAIKLTPMNWATLPLLSWIYVYAWRKNRI